MTKPVDLDAVREALAALDRIAEQNPDLLGPPSKDNRRRWEALLSEETMSPLVGTRLDDALVARLDRHVERLRKTQPGAIFTRSDAIRILLNQALDLVESDAGPEEVPGSKRPAKPKR